MKPSTFINRKEGTEVIGGSFHIWPHDDGPLAKRAGVYLTILILVKSRENNIQGKFLLWNKIYCFGDRNILENL